MSDLTLIQLISEQTIQNLLPILRLRPTGLIHLVTPRTAARSALLKSAAHAVGLNPTLEVVQLSAMPGISECSNVVAELLRKVESKGGRAVVNFTGGTKLMSIGAFTAAKTAKVPSLYVDTQDSCFLDGSTSLEMRTLLGGDWSFTSIRNQLRVDVIGIANGVPRVTSGKPWEAVLPLAEHLFNEVRDEESTHGAIHGTKGLFPAGREPRSPRDWLSYLDRPISLPESVARLAVASGLVRSGSEKGHVLLPDDTRKELEQLSELTSFVSDFNERVFRALAPLQHAAAFLSGAWWEVIVCDATEKSGLFRDLRWSCQVGDRNGPDTEEDILAAKGVELLYVNCKRGGTKARLLPLLEEIRARAASIGGNFNRRYLAVLQAPTGKVAANLQQRAKALGIGIITGNNVYDAGVFDR